MSKKKTSKKIKYIVLITLLILSGGLLAWALASYVPSGEVVVRNEITYIIFIAIVLLPVMLLVMLFAMIFGKKRVEDNSTVEISGSLNSSTTSIATMGASSNSISIDTPTSQAVVGAPVMAVPNMQASRVEQQPEQEGEEEEKRSRFYMLTEIEVGGQAVLGRQHLATTPWLTERHGYDPTWQYLTCKRRG